MGGASRRGGSDTSDEKKQDSYGKQFRKQYTVNKKTGKVKKRNVISRILINSPTGTVVGDFADNHNYKRRLKFAEKNNLNLISKSKEYLISPAARSYLDEFGYADTLKDKTGINNKTRDRDSANQLVQAPPIATTMPVRTPTTAEVSQAQSTSMTQKDILLANKKKGRKENLLTSAQGLGTNNLIIKKNKLGAA